MLSLYFTSCFYNTFLQYILCMWVEFQYLNVWIWIGMHVRKCMCGFLNYETGRYQSTMMLYFMIYILNVAHCHSHPVTYIEQEALCHVLIQPTCMLLRCCQFLTYINTPAVCTRGWKLLLVSLRWICLG